MSRPLPVFQRGTSLIEVMVTLVVLAFGLLGLAAFQTKAQVGSVESYQRAAASVLLEDMQSRMIGNRSAAASYVTTTPLGTKDGITSCAGLAGVALDQCEWSMALKGAGEMQGTAQAGAIQGARGCVTQVQASNPAPGVCTPAVYRVTVAWQGLHPTKAPSQTCGTGQYGPESYRRAISVRVAVGLPTCI